MSSLQTNLHQFSSCLISSEQEMSYVEYLINYYHTRLNLTPKALDYVMRYCCTLRLETLEHFRIGFVDRTLVNILPKEQSGQTEIIRGVLQRYGWLKPNGRERFRGALVFPVFNASGQCVNAFAYRISPYMRKGCSRILQLNSTATFFNQKILADCLNIILCVSPFVALKLFNAGVSNVIAVCGAVSIESHSTLLHQAGVIRVVIAINPEEDIQADEMGLLAESLSQLGINCRLIYLPDTAGAVDIDIRYLCFLAQQCYRGETC
ncbi:hypothetical protein [Shewanella sp. OMA3-2]|uniref:hypothetical protein n=1 Tax=Shewanella sp. OMA3-2 TaxID=2908650 RepID=UPI001F2A2DC5|nr:hypothetical protein [Shewanella sp. OMA3-2]UJF21691.1 hypothetical protein L0B17_16810 [Shewanella sp. OMA3-2]